MSVDPNTSVHLDPSTVRILWGALVTFLTTMGLALGVVTTVAVKARTWFLQSERAKKSDDHVHGIGKTIEPKADDLGLVENVAQIKDAQNTLTRRVRNIEIHGKLPDMSDSEALARLALERLDTGQHRAVILAEEDRRRSLPPHERERSPETRDSKQLPFESQYKGRPK